jgi:hypothetical protein
VRFASASLRLSTADTTAPYEGEAPGLTGCVWVVDQMHTAEEMYVTLNALLPGKVAVWTTDHDKGCKKPTKVFNPAARFIKDDLKDHAVAIVTHKMFGGKQGHKARQVMHPDGHLCPRVLTVVDEQPDEVTIYDIDMAAAERVRSFVKADDQLAVSVGPHMDTLVRFMHPRTFGGASIEKPTDDPEAWRAAEDLQWFASSEASYFVRDHRGLMPDCLEAVFGFAKALARGYGFLARDGQGTQNTHFIGYESNLITTQGTLLLDATADIDGVSQLCPWREHSELPQASYGNLKVLHVPQFTKAKLHRFFKLPSNRRAYTAWMVETIKEHMAPGQKGLVVCKQRLIDEENVPRWIEEDQHSDSDESTYYWEIEGRRLCAVNWGRGIGSNAWKEADVVFLFDEYYLPRRIVIARAQGYRKHKAIEGALGSMHTLNAKAAAVDILLEGHLLRFTKQMALRGRGRRYDEHGACEPQKVVASGDLKRLVANFNRLFPGAEIESVRPRKASLKKEKQAEGFLAVMSRPGLPQTISTSWLGQQMHTPWREVSKHVLPQEDVQQALANLGWLYAPKSGRGGGSFVRSTGETRLSDAVTTALFGSVSAYRPSPMLEALGAG